MADGIKKDMVEVGIDPERWMEAAQDQQRWRSAVEQTYGCLSPGHG